MSHADRLRYNPVLLGAGATVTITRPSIGGFLCTTSGTITIVRDNGDGTTTTVVTALPVTAGQWTDIPLYLGGPGRKHTVTSASAVGVVAT